MHLHTLVKVRAENEEEAVSEVNGLMWDGIEGGPFDYFDEDGTEIWMEGKGLSAAELAKSERMNLPSCAERN